MPDITKHEPKSVAENVLTLIAEKNSDIDNGILLNRINQIIAKTPKLAQFPSNVIAEAILKAMIPDPTLAYHDDIYFIPYGNKIDVSFSHNYLQKLAYKNGAVKIINTYLIYEGDIVEITENGLTYKVLPFKPQGEFVGVLVDITLKNGERKYGTVTREHIEQARKASKSGNNGPWKNWYYEMAKKVALKNTMKGIDISPEFSDAVAIDNEDTDFDKTNNIESSTSSSLEDAMISSSKTIATAEQKIEELGIVFEIRGDWVAINIEASPDGSEEKLEKLGAKIVKKDNKPGYAFFKISDIK